jgi:hypothetical protein
MPTLRHHPGTLTDEELIELDIAATKLSSKASRLCAWLASYVEYERARRRAAEFDEPIEPEMPKLNAATWTDGELLDALWVSFTTGRMLRHRRNASKLMDEVHNCLILWSRARLAPK